MFLIKTPSQHFSSSRATASRYVLVAGGKSRKRLVTGREYAVSDG
ncbi:hypothetical protein [Reticulibacter mediterranei]|nr:hypothetical protein [Reticulibacter mediterranei]